MKSLLLAKYSSLVTALLLVLAGGTSALEMTIPSLYFGFLLIPFFIIMVVAVHYHSKEGKLFGLLAILFSAMYGTLISFNYFLQFAFRERGVPLPDLFDITNTNSLFWVIELLGYFFMGLTTLFLIPLLSNTLLDRSIKLCFLLNALLGLGGLVGYVLKWDLNILFVGLIAWNIILPLAAVLLYFRFRKLESASG